MTDKSETKVYKEENIQYDEEINVVGFIVNISIFGLCGLFALSIVSIFKNNFMPECSITLLSDIGCIFMMFYYFNAVCRATFLLGKPDKKQLIPVVIGGIFTFVAGCIRVVQELMSDSHLKELKNPAFWLEFLCPIPFIAFAYYVHMLDDAEESNLLFLKPWKKTDRSMDSKV